MEEVCVCGGVNGRVEPCVWWAVCACLDVGPGGGVQLHLEPVMCEEFGPDCVHAFGARHGSAAVEHAQGRLLGPTQPTQAANQQTERQIIQRKANEKHTKGKRKPKESNNNQSVLEGSHFKKSRRSPP